MWNEPYLETCCRAALHRLVLSGAGGRPGGLKDGPCLHRLAGMGFAAPIRTMESPEDRYGVTSAGRERHSSEILKAEAV